MSDEKIEAILSEDAIPDGWRPREGSTVWGKVLKVTSGWSEQSESSYPIVVVDDEIGKKPIAIHAFHFILKRELMKLKPKDGELIGIKMGKKVPLKNNPNRSVQTYVVKMPDRDTSGEVWEDLTKGEKAPVSAVEIPDNELPGDEETPF